MHGIELISNYFTLCTLSQEIFYNCFAKRKKKKNCNTLKFTHETFVKIEEPLIHLYRWCSARVINYVQGIYLLNPLLYITRHYLVRDIIANGPFNHTYIRIGLKYSNWVVQGSCARCVQSNQRFQS